MLARAAVLAVLVRQRVEVAVDREVECAPPIHAQPTGWDEAQRHRAESQLAAHVPLGNEIDSDLAALPERRCV